MADIQVASPAKFFQVASANKAAQKEGVSDKAGLSDGKQPSTFMGALRAKLNHAEATAGTLTIKAKATSDLNTRLNTESAVHAADLVAAEEARKVVAEADSGVIELSEPDGEADQTIADADREQGDIDVLMPRPGDPTTQAAVAAMFEGFAKQTPKGEASTALASHQASAQTRMPGVDGKLLAASEKSLLNNGDLTDAVESGLSGEAVAETTPDSSAISISILADSTIDKGNTSLKSNIRMLNLGNEAANAAEARQTLPAELRAGQVAATPDWVDPALAESADEAGKAAISLFTTGRVEGGGAQTIVLPHGFDATSRQVEAKVNASIESPVRSPTFATELGDKVVWLAGRQTHMADLSLNPPSMGSLEVRLTISGGDATAQFFSPNPLVRDAIDAALPRLRDLMSQAGLNLGEANVRDQAFGRRDSPNGQAHANTPNVDTGSGQGVLSAMGTRMSSGVGLVDLYI